MNVDFGIVMVLLVLVLVAGFGYYGGFIALLTRQVRLDNGRVLKGTLALLLGVGQLLGAAAASAVAILFYFSRIR